MTISIIIISHEEIATAFVNTAKTTYGDKLPLPISTVEIQPDADPDHLIPELRRILAELNRGDGVLILTDLFGSTPNNIARECCDLTKILVVTGLNLPMLLRVLNYPNLRLEELAEKALEAGQSGIIKCE